LAESEFYGGWGSSGEPFAEKKMKSNIKKQKKDRHPGAGEMI
jgi:hypothetical protein